MNLSIVGQIPHEPYMLGAVDDLNVPIESWGTPASVNTYGWWPPSVEQILGQEPQRRAIEISLALMVPIGTVCADKDRWTVGGTPMLQVADAQDYNHGPWGMQVPLIVYLKTVEG